MSETKHTLEITINVERKVEWTMRDTITVEGTKAECLAEAERIEGLDAEEQIKLIAKDKDTCPDTFLYDDDNWDYSTEEYIEESVDYDEPMEVK